jgi:hypothetical protein
MKKGVFVVGVFILLVFSIGFASAGFIDWFKDFFGGITGRTSHNVTAPATIECYSDSECGSNYYNGNYYCINSTGVYRDYIIVSCRNAGTTNADCEEQTLVQLQSECSSGEECVAGQSTCQATSSGSSSCTRTGGGDPSTYDPNIKQTVCDSNGNCETDTCDYPNDPSDTDLFEYYCNGGVGSITFTIYNCGAGKICSGGACVVETSASTNNTNTSSGGTGGSGSGGSSGGSGGTGGTGGLSPPSGGTGGSGSGGSSGGSGGGGGSGPVLGENVVRSNVETRSYFDESGNDVKVDSEEIFNNDGSSTRNEKRVFTDSSGNEIKKINVITEFQSDGSRKTNEKREFFRDGKKVDIDIEIVTREGSVQVKRKITVDGKIVDVVSDIDVIDKIVDGRVVVNAKLSDGNEESIEILPDQVDKIVREETGIVEFDVILREIEENEKKKLIYVAESKNEGKFLGLFRVEYNGEVYIDPNSGVIIENRNPWWRIFVFGKSNVKSSN